MPAKAAERKEEHKSLTARIQQLKQEKAYIANILPLPWTMVHTLGTVHIPACPEGELYSLVEVGPKSSIMDLGDKRTMAHEVLAAEFAEDIVKMVNGDAGDGSFLGVFICGEDGPTDEELVSANRRVDEFGERLMKRADVDFARPNGNMFITDLDRYMATRLKQEKPWNGTVSAMEECPACGTKIRAAIAVCPTCKAILDREKAIKFGLVPEPTPEPKPHAKA